MSFKKELYEAVSARITQDAEMEALMGTGFVLDFETVPPNAEWPFLVAKLSSKPAAVNGIFIRGAKLYIDLWHRAMPDTGIPDHERVIDIVDRLERLFNGKLARCSSGTARFYFEADFPVPVHVSGPHVEHELNRHAIVFSLRNIDGSLIEAYLDV